MAISVQSLVRVIVRVRTFLSFECGVWSTFPQSARAFDRYYFLKIYVSIMYMRISMILPILTAASFIETIQIFTGKLYYI